MIAFINGRVSSVSEGNIVIENNGIGFDLNVSSNTLQSAGVVGKNLQLFTYLQVRDDGLSLFGFATAEEKAMFLRLITISGVGPKLALSVLSGMELNSLALAIVTGDVKSLSKIKGVGKKTAERIVLELKGQLSAEESATGGDIFTGATADEVFNDAVAALVTLSVPRAQAVKAVTAARAKTEVLEEVITYALRMLDFRG